VFFSSCTSVDFHHALLTQPISLSGGQPGSEGLEAGAGQLLVPGVLKLHGDMPQKERTSAFLTFSQVRRECTQCLCSQQQALLHLSQADAHQVLVCDSIVRRDLPQQYDRVD
jgi:hypothetical protein